MEQRKKKGKIEENVRNKRNGISMRIKRMENK